MPELEFPEHLPAILIGVQELRAPLANELPWGHSVHHQHGGYACLQSQLYGVVLPLASVAACSPLIAGFEALALDSPSKSAFSRFPELESLHLTAGNRYPDGLLDNFQRFLSRAEFVFPPVTQGTEALLELATASPSQFVGWPILMLEMPDGVALDDRDARQHAVGPLGIYPGRNLSEAALDRLREVIGEGPRVFLLWNNSD